MSLLITDFNEIWEIAAREIEKKLGEATFSEWFKGMTCLGYKQGVLQFLALDSWKAIWVNDNYLGYLKEQLSIAAGHSVEVVVLEPTEQDCSSTILPSKPAVPVSTKPIIPLPPTISANSTFDNFVVGPDNEMAFITAKTVAENPQSGEYNPLFIYGTTGVGKTHLMHAVANYVFSKNPNVKINYVTCEQFANDYVRALRDRDPLEFRRHYRQFDVLLVDDIQFLATKEQFQEEFFHTFNEITSRNGQIILTSDRPAGEIPGLAQRIVSRCQCGMVVDIQAPSYETRLAILQKKAVDKKFDFMKYPTVLEYIAKNITRNIRNLEGAINRLIGYVNIYKPVKIEGAVLEKIFYSFLCEEETYKIDVSLIQRKVAEFYKIDVEKMVSKGRQAVIALPRQIAMYLCTELTDLKLVAIGNAFGGRDHGTIIHARKTIADRCDVDAQLKKQVEMLRAQLRSYRS